MRETSLSTPYDMSRVLVMILAGGEGKRLFPLTADRAKPAVPFGCRYRIIDFVLSNFVNSGLFRIKILTQYKSASLEEHIARVWRLAAILDNYVETIPAQQRTGKSWFKGSADAVHQCDHVITDANPELVFIFGGDHVYKMDVRQMLQFHAEHNASLTVATVPVKRYEASGFGIMQVDETGRVVKFLEKPTDPPTIPGRPEWCLASMGNYLFNTDKLLERLDEDTELETSSHDFGHDILPMMVEKGDRVFAYDFQDNHVPGEEPGHVYWRDIGTTDAYFWAQMDLVGVRPQFNLYNEHWPLRTGMRHDPPAKFVFNDEETLRVGTATDSLVSNGCIISGGTINRTLLAPRCRINSFSEVEESILFDNVNIGRHAQIRRAIIDKNVDVPAHTVIGHDLTKDRERFFVSEGGIVVVEKNTTFET